MHSVASAYVTTPCGFAAAPGAAPPASASSGAPAEAWAWEAEVPTPVLDAPRGLWLGPAAPASGAARFLPARLELAAPSDALRLPHS